MLAEQSVLIAKLEAKIVELEKRAKKNSGNRSKPPSSDGLTKPPKTTSLRESGKNKSGGQFGHKGETLKQVETPEKKDNLVNALKSMQDGLALVMLIAKVSLRSVHLPE